MSQQRTWTRAELPPELERALGAAIERGARAPVVLRLTEVAGYTDWALLLSARSERQVRGVVEGIREALAAAGTKPMGTDGLDLYLWALLDYDDFLVHVFYHPVRRHYDLESMWSDAPRVELDLPAEILDDSDLDGLSAPEPMPAFRGDMAFGGFEDEFIDDDDDDDDDDDELEGEDPDFVDDDMFEDEPTDPGPDTDPGPAPAPNPDDDLFDS